MRRYMKSSLPMTDVERISAKDESNILNTIVAAVSLGALALLIAQMSIHSDSPSNFIKHFGVATAIATWISSILLLAVSIWRHHLAKRGYPVKGSDWGFYGSVLIVMLTLMVAMVWLALAGFLTSSTSV